MKHKIIIGIGGLCVVLILLYTTMVIRSNSLISDALKSMNYQSAQFDGVHVYIDGIIIDKLTLEPNKTLQTVYIQADPFQQIMHRPTFISVKNADITVNSLFKEKIGFISNIPFTVEKTILHFKTTIETIDVTVKIKQSSATSVMIYFDGKASHADISGQGEVYFSDNSIKNINLDFSKIDMDYLNLSTKRADGWLSFIYKDGWIISGELGAGYADINSLQLSDSSITISGTAEHPTWNLTGKDDKTKDSVAIEQSNKNVKTSFKNQEFVHDAASHFSLDDFDTVEKDLRSVRPLQVIEITKQRPHMMPKITKSVIRKIPNDTLQIVEAVKKNFNDLILNSFFEGMNYSNDLTIIDVPCPVSGQTSCWTARSRGGVLRYDVLPSYFTRMKDYAASTALRNILKKLAIKTLTVQGKDGQAQELVINGMTDSGQPVYIELSVSDVN